MDHKDVQSYLGAKGFYSDEIDGIVGRKTEAAAARLLRTRTSDLAMGHTTWNEKRKYNAVKQLMCKDLGLEVGGIDGLIGPQSLYAFEVWDRVSKDKKEDLWRDSEEDKDDRIAELALPTGQIWPKQSSVRTQNSAFYGKVGTNQTMLECPYPMYLAWDTSKVINRFSCHEKVHDSLENILGEVLNTYGEAKIKSLGLDQFGGCLNVRTTRGGSRYSMHSWGIALDLDPANNRLRWNHTKAKFARAEYKSFWRIVGDQGWVALGPAKDYDWMHLQAARL
jgi:hypothetical protein